VLGFRVGATHGLTLPGETRMLTPPCGNLVLQCPPSTGEPTTSPGACGLGGLRLRNGGPVLRAAVAAAAQPCRTGTDIARFIRASIGRRGEIVLPCAITEKRLWCPGSVQLCILTGVAAACIRQFVAVVGLDTGWPPATSASDSRFGATALLSLGAA